MRVALFYTYLVHVLLAIRLQSVLGNKELPRHKDNNLVESLLYRRQAPSLSTGVSTSISATSSDSATVATTTSSDSATVATTASSSSTAIATTASSTDYYGLGYLFWFPTSISTTSAGTTTTVTGSPTSTDTSKLKIFTPTLYSVSTYSKIFKIVPDYDYPQVFTNEISDGLVYYNLNFTSCIQECAQWNFFDQWASDTYTGCSGVSHVRGDCYIKTGSPHHYLADTAPVYSPGNVSAVLYLISGAPPV